MGESKADAAQTAAVLTSRLLTNPNVLAAFTQELGSMVGKSSGYIESLPKSVKRRIGALKKLQVELFELESQFYADIHELECKYSKLYAPVFNKRRDIVDGKLEPTDSECDWSGEQEEEGEEEEKQQPKLNGDVKKDVDSQSGVKTEADDEEQEANGIPEFWLTIFKNVEELSALVQEHDEPVLKNLEDVRITYLCDDKMGFRIEFHFSPNEFFTNTVLTKDYYLSCKPDKAQPLSYEGPEIVKCSGCHIDWKNGKNITEKSVKQKSKNQKKKVVKKTVKVNSFFNFFSPPVSSEDSAENDETEELLMADYELGRLLQERIVPRAVLYFTGEALDDDDDEGEGEEDEDADEVGEDYDEGEDPDYEPPAGTKDGPPYCQQQ